MTAHPALAYGGPTRYRIVRRLGAGGMGTVFLAVDRQNRPVAVKVLHEHLRDDPVFRRRFTREVQVAYRVTGPGTARVLDAAPESHAPYLVTEYVPGDCLHDRIHEHGPFGGTELAALASGVAVALTTIHGAGVVHRDLKPRNVMLSPDGPKVIDFGVAGAVDRETLLGFGTPGWLAPEQLAGQAGGTAADVFAWGLLVTWAGTGLHPARFRPDPERLPAALRPLVRAALAVDPGARPTAADLVRRCGLRPPTTRPTGTTGPIGATVPIGTTSASHASVPVDTTGPTRATGPSHPTVPVDTTGPTRATGPSHPTAPIGTTGSSHPDRPRTIPGHPTRRRHPTGPSYATRATRATHLRPVPTSPAQPAPPVGPPPRVRPPRRRLRIGGRLVTLALLTALLVAGWQLTGRYGQSRAGTAAPTGAASQPAAPPQPGRGGGGQATAADRTPAARPDNRDVTPVPPRTYTAARADTARAGGLAFTLTGMRCGEPEVGSWPVRRAATGRYCRVDLKVANTGDHAGFVFAGSQELTDAGGQRHTADNWAWVYEAGARAFTAPLEAGDSVTGTLVFDVPADATFTALTLYDTPLSRGTAIALH